MLIFTGTITVPVGTAVWPVKAVGRVNLPSLLPQKMWCESRKRLTRPVIIRTAVAIPQNQKFSRFLKTPDAFCIGLMIAGDDSKGLSIINPPSGISGTEPWIYGIVFPKNKANFPNLITPVNIAVDFETNWIVD